MADDGKYPVASNITDSLGANAITKTGPSSNGDARDSQELPAVTLPKGGGAIRNMGEKFAANPTTGTGGLSVPLATSPGRGGLAPKLSLSYDSGAGNGAFGFGRSLSLPTITRKTDKGLPTYDDRTDTDVFVLAGAEDLVPLLGPDGSPAPRRSAQLCRLGHGAGLQPRGEQLWVLAGRESGGFLLFVRVSGASWFC